MALPMTPIFTQTVGAGGASNITFNNIPQHFTDVYLVASARDTNNTSPDFVSFLTFNSDTSSGLYSATRLYGAGSGSGTSDRQSGAGSIYAAHATGGTSVSGVFTNCQIYIPNYSSSNFKSTMSDYVVPQNAATGGTYQVFVAGLWRNTNAITSIRLGAGGTSFAQYSTFSLYGIIRPGA